MNNRLKKILRYVALSYLVVFFVLLGIWILLSGGDSCTAGQEVAEGCKVAFPETGVLIGLVSIPVAGIVSLIGVVLDAFKKGSRP